MSQKKNSKTKGNKLSPTQLQREILKLFRRQPKKRLNPKQIARKLKVDNNRDSIQHALNMLAENKQLLDKGHFKYQLNRKTDSAPAQQGRRSDKTAEGLVDMTRSGDGYIMVDGMEDDIHISAKLMNTALHGDRVRIRYWRPRGRRRQEGEVVEVLERASEHFVGTIWLYPNYAIVVPEGKVPIDIVVDLAHTADAADGDKVIVEVTQWRSKTYPNPEGKITMVLGQAGSHDIEMKSILINNGFNLTYPPNVLKETEFLPGEIIPGDMEARRDLRGVTTFTIDPDTARDFDDALSVEKLENGHIEVGIHIADVSHYVRPGMALDKEAYRRSTSVYLVDRVLPMLPERLSNELCSLRPHEDKLTFSAVFTFDDQRRLRKRWFGKTIIHSDRRFTYEEAQAVIESGTGDFPEEMTYLNELAKALRRRRFREGSINFESDEVKFRLDENGAPVEIYMKERKEAHMLVEDFMLLANREVAAFMHKKGGQKEKIPFVYRVHDEPNSEKVQELARFAGELGFSMKVDTPRDIARSYNRLVEAARKDRGLKLLEPIAIRTMAKAIYTTDNIGHYGLGFDNYTHFTSPIRRYSDVLVHRILEQNLGRQVHKEDETKLEEMCKHISMQERKAMDAERESVKYKQVEFIENHIGEVFVGRISGIIERGLFVALEDNLCEGLVDFSSMDEAFDLMEGGLRVRGRRSGHILKMGQRVKVRILRTDLARRQIDMGWEGPAPDQQKSKKKKKATQRG